MFYWGNSVSSMQTEGGWDEGGKSLSVYDIRPKTEELSDWHFANDNYHHYEEDMDLMQDLGMNMYRFQTSWSRCVKDGDGDFNEEGLAYYDKFIDALIERGIEPMICLYHFDMPLNLAKEHDGFLSKETLNAFIRYGKKMIDRFSGKVKYWLTFNEQNLYHGDGASRYAGYLKGSETDDELYQILHNVMVAHATLCNYLHEKTRDAKIGGMLAYTEVYPATCKPQDVKCAREIDEFMNFTLLDCFAYGKYSEQMMKLVDNRKINMNILPGELETISKQKNDFLAFSYYSSFIINSDDVTEGMIPNRYPYGNEKNPYLETTEWNWQNDALGFRDILNKMYQRYHIPVFPIENGIGVREHWDGVHPIADDYRIDYHREHLKAMYDAITEDGVKVLGYLGWGLIDILSSQGDMEKRYGLVYVNRSNHDLKDMRRVPKKSYDWFKEVIRTNGQSLYDQ